VTAETENEVIAVELRTGRVMRRVHLARDPENVAVAGGAAVAVSAAAGVVTILNPFSLQVIKVITGFDDPHIPAISPDGRYAYVTDDAGGTLTVIRLSDARVVSRIAVGAGAHHLSFSPDERRLWIALRESARTIAILDTADRARPRLIGSFDPGFAAHQVAFAPDGRRVWITSSSGPSVAVFAPARRKLLFRVPVGPPPQHVGFDGRDAYLTSGYGGVLEKVDAATGRILARAIAPYGSFELDSAHGFVSTTSLLRGTLAIYDTSLRLLRVLRLAPAARDVAITASS
jgi:DNA-binding beta-propeller fold protein YncE